MMTMAEETTGGSVCRECGGAIPADALTMGLCPRCLIATVAHVRRDGPAPAPEAPRPVDRLTCERVAAAFPEVEIIELLGQGGMGAVFKARHRKLGGVLAIKVMAVDDYADRSAVERFLGEGRILTTLDHAHIVKAYASGQAAGYAYLLLELVQGPSLRQILMKGPLPCRTAAKVATQVCCALVYAHRRGIIHRDIKPENILLHPGTVPASAGLHGFFEGGGRVRLADFGLARTEVDPTKDISLTLPNQRVGTIDYMAPETRTGRSRAGTPGDIYAVGVVLYEMLTGKLPIGRFPLPSEVNADAKCLDALVVSCLQNDPLLRCGDIGALRTELAKLSQPARKGVTWQAVLAGVVALAIVAVVVIAMMSR